MTFDPSLFGPVPKNWFVEKVQYLGTGRAEFTDPPGIIKGAATVEVTKTGKCRVRIHVEKVESQNQQGFSFTRGQAASEPSFVNGIFNPCKSLVVETPQGIFTGGERIINNGVVSQNPDQVELIPLHSEFEGNGNRVAKYWVLPLINFLPSPWQCFYHSNLSDHPLRVATWPVVPDGLADEDRGIVLFRLQEGGKLYTFTSGNEAGFIERLSDFSKRSKWIKRNHSRAITALMVGPAHVQTIAWSDPISLFPIDILSALSLATGIVVGAPWIEFRDESGALVRRVHICFGATRYKKLQPILCNLSIGNGSGYLTGKVLSATESGQKYLRAATNQFLQSLNQSANLESTFISLCRSFETLCRHHGFIQQDLSARLDTTQKDKIKSILSEAAQKIHLIRAKESDVDRKTDLQRIVSRLQSVSQKEKSFGVAIEDLAEKFGFKDKGVLDNHFSNHPHCSGHSAWSGVLTHYRAAATHDAYFDWKSRAELYEILQVKHHLQDLLLRILLKTIDYDGPYISPIPQAFRAPKESIDWVKPNTSARQLGFG